MSTPDERTREIEAAKTNETVVMEGRDWRLVYRESSHSYFFLCFTPEAAEVVRRVIARRLGMVYLAGDRTRG